MGGLFSQKSDEDHKTLQEMFVAEVERNGKLEKEIKEVKEQCSKPRGPAPGQTPRRPPKPSNIKF